MRQTILAILFLAQSLVAQYPIVPRASQRWHSLWATPLPTTNSPIVIRKSLKGRSTEANAAGPLNAVIYQPTESSGRYWARTFLSSQSIGGTNTCAARILRTTYSELFAGSSQTPPNTGSGELVNRDSGTQAYAQTLLIEGNATTNRTEVSGTWAAHSGGGNTPITRYSATASATVRYTVTGVTRIHWRAYNNASNGGQISCVVTNSATGVEIDNAQYLVGPEGGTRNLSQQFMSSAYNDTRIAHFPIAKGLSSTNTYTVTLTLSSGTRIYDSGMLGYSDANDRDGYAYKTLGVHGVWENYTSFGNNKYQGGLYAGCRAVYAFTNVTDLTWKYAARVNGGRAAFRVYDSTGTEMSIYYASTLATSANGDRYVNTFEASTAERTASVATGLPVGTYYVHVYSLPTKDNSFTQTTAAYSLSSAYAIYDGSFNGVNKGAAGVVGTDSFIDTDAQWLGGNADPLDGIGNLVWAGQVRDTGDPNLSALTETGYVTGTHSAESYPSNIVVSVDGVALSWSGAADQTQWTGQNVVITFDTKVGTQSNPTSWWADASYRYEINRLGWLQSLTLTTTRNIQRGTWYEGMLLAGNNTVSYTANNSAISNAPTAGAVYTFSGLTNTVESVTVGATTTLIVCSTSNGVPTATSGTLTKLSGTGDATLVFVNSSAPVHLGTGFRNLWIEPARRYTAVYNGPEYLTATTHRGFAYYTPEGYVVAMHHLNPGTIWQDWDGTNSATLFSQRTRTSKSYAIMNRDTAQTTGTLLSSGYSRGWTNRIRFFTQPGLQNLLGN